MKTKLKKIERLIKKYQREAKRLPLCSYTRTKYEGIAIGLQNAYDLLTEEEPEKNSRKTNA